MAFSKETALWLLTPALSSWPRPPPATPTGPPTGLVPTGLPGVAAAEVSLWLRPTTPRATPSSPPHPRGAVHLPPMRGVQSTLVELTWISELIRI